MIEYRLPAQAGEGPHKQAAHHSVSCFHIRYHKGADDLPKKAMAPFPVSGKGDDR